MQKLLRRQRHFKAHKSFILWDKISLSKEGYMLNFEEFVIFFLNNCKLTIVSSSNQSMGLFHRKNFQVSYKKITKPLFARNEKARNYNNVTGI